MRTLLTLALLLTVSSLHAQETIRVPLSVEVPVFNAETLIDRIEALESVPPYDPSAIRLRIDALESRIESLEADTPVDPDPPTDRRLVTPDDFRFVGGWRVTNKGAREDDNNSIFDRMGLYVEAADDGKKHVYLCDRAKGNVQQFAASMDSIGTDPTGQKSWPLMEPAGIWGGQKINHRQPYAVTRPNEGGEIMVTGKTFYATGGFTDPYLSWLGGTMIESPGAAARQVFGGGFVTIPKWFADEHLGGNDFGVGLGGYRSGQGSPTGPTLAVLPRPSEGMTAIEGGQVLLRYPWTGEAHEREQRPADYTSPLFGPPVDGDTGYWQADEVVGGPIWIDSDDVQGLCYLSIQGIGDLDYNLQNPTFSNERKIRLYVYDPADLALVANGQMQPHEVRGKFHEWAPPWGWEVTSQSWPGGMFWDGEYLYVAYKHAGAEQYDRPPVVAIYELAGAATNSMNKEN